MAIAKTNPVVPSESSSPAAEKLQRIKSLSFSGLRALSPSEAQKLMGVDEGAVFNKSQILQQAERIRTSLKELAYFNSNVKVDFRGLQTPSVDIAIQVMEGERTKITSIQIQSPNADLNTSLQKIADRKIEEPYSLANLTQLKKELRAYLTDHQYFRADIPEPTAVGKFNDTEVDLTFKVEHPQFYILEVEGQSDGVTYSMIHDNIGFDDFRSTSPQLAQEIGQKTRNYLYTLGYARAEVTASEVDGFSAFQKKIHLDIVQSKKVTISKLEFTGRLSESPEFYNRFIIDQGGSSLGSRIYVKEDFEKALKNLVVDRRNNGYFRAKVISSRTAYNEDHDAVTIFVNLDEGPLTVVQRIDLTGVEKIDEEQIFAQLKIQTQEPLRLNVLEKGLDAIKELYRKNGFLEMKIANEEGVGENLVTYNEDNTLANLKIKIVEGPRIIVDSILVQGNTLTNEYVIYKELEFKKGDVLTPAKIEETKARLQRLGIFSAIEIRTLEENTDKSLRTVLVVVNDRNPGLRNFGLGATTERRFTMRGFGGLAYRNIGGMGRVASARVDVNYLTDIPFLERKLVLSYLEPYLFDTRLKGRLTFTEATFVSDFNALSAVDLFQTNVALEQEVTSHIRASWDLINYSKYHTYSAVQDSTYVETNIDIGATGPNIELDYRDHPFNPTRGSLTRASSELGLPELASSDPIRYLKYTVSYAQFWNPVGRLVWANNVRGGYLQNYSNGGYVPYDKKGFILGGAQTIRGFTNSEAFPNSSDLKSTSYQLTTEASMYLVKSELRFPLRGNVGGAIFYDGGNVWIRNYDFHFSYRHSAGFAARYNTPVGPISAEIGWKLNEIGSRGESPFAFNLAIGTF
jgi:outer membrane protein assembly complex protein YaeT